jgi:hypothetical protein
MELARGNKWQGHLDWVDCKGPWVQKTLERGEPQTGQKPQKGGGGINIILL